MTRTRGKKEPASYPHARQVLIYVTPASRWLTRGRFRHACNLTTGLSDSQRDGGVTVAKGLYPVALVTKGGRSAKG
jgi:hypothetical protein